jgi:type IV pilus assembly protein PilM
VDELKAAVKTAGLSVYNITPSIISPVNAFEAAHPDLFTSDALALVDIGFQHSSISILIGGELILSRVVAIGGDRLTSDLAESMGISYAEAEGIKVGMPQEVQATLQNNLLALGRELRASIDFFEHQHDKTISQVFVSGGTARSELILQTLQSELMVPCKAWNPTSFMKLALPPQQLGEVEQIAPQLAVAVGGALAAC